MPTPEPAVSTTTEPTVDLNEEVWRGTPDPILNPVGGRTTRYVATRSRITVDKGLIGKSNESLELFRVKDISVKKSIAQRARGAGDVVVTSTDASTPSLVLESISQPDSVAQTLREVVGEARSRHNIYLREGL